MRFLRTLFIAALFAAIFPSAHAGAESVEDAAEDVSEASGAVGDAQRDRARLREAIESLSSTRSQVLDQLLSTLDEYERRNAELEEVTYLVANLRSRLVDTELDVTELRAAVQERAIRAYMRGTFEANTVIWTSASFQEAAILMQAVEGSSARDADALRNLNSTRRLLGDLRQDYETVRGRLLEIRDQLGGLASDLESRFSAADSSLAQAYRDLDQADRRYQSALTDLEEAQRKLATFRGSGQWRPIVTRYFRPALVEDALFVMQCESSGNPDATNPINGAAGLYQFLSGTWTYASAGAGFGGSSRYDAEANIAAAAWLAHRYQDRGSSPWSPWSCGR